MLSFALALAAAAPLPPQQQCEHEAVRTATLNASAATRLSLIARAGRLQVEGREGLSQVRVRGRACASSAALLEELQLEAAAASGTARVEVLAPEPRTWNGRDHYAYMDLVVEVPLGMAATIRDGSGAAVLIALGELDVEDGSGDLRIEDARGSVTVADGSGSVEILGVAGDVRVSDGSGDLTIRDVRGSVTIEDGSGDVEVRAVTGTVTIEEDSSGGIDVADVGRDFIVRRDGSGDIRYRDVQGEVQVPQKGRRRG